MDSLAAIYEWKKSPQTGGASPSEAMPSPAQACECETMSPAELEVQQLKAKTELALLRDRVRKVCAGWLGANNSTEAPIRFTWQIQPYELVSHLCYWKHTSALSVVGMTPYLAEVTRTHRKLDGASPEPPASKNKLTLVVWNLAATVQSKLLQWRSCVDTETEELFDGDIVVRVSDLVPLWMWEADILRHRPALASLCDRMLSLGLLQYRQRCHQLTQKERKLLRNGQTPFLTPLGLNWTTAATTPSVVSTKAKSQTTTSSSNRPPTVPAPAAAIVTAIVTPPKKVFAGETFCVSGEFSLSQKEMLELIRDNGGKLAPTFNRSCTYVVAGSIGSAKTRKAQAAGIPIVTEEWVHSSIKKGRKSTDPSLFLTPMTGNRVASKRNVAVTRTRGGDVDSDDEESDADDSSYVDSENGNDSESSEEEYSEPDLIESDHSSDESENDSTAARHRHQETRATPRVNVFKSKLRLPHTE